MANIEFIGEKIFLQEIEAGGRVWVAENAYHAVHAMELDETGLSLPVWSTRERAVQYLMNVKLLGPKYEPQEVPVTTFADAWLSDMAKGITELQINPDGTSDRVLCLTPEEFRESQHLH